MTNSLKERVRASMAVALLLLLCFEALALSVPRIEVSGIVISERGRWAILRGQSQGLIVRPRQKLGDYTVKRIERAGVTLGFKKYEFFCPLTVP